MTNELKTTGIKAMATTTATKTYLITDDGDSFSLSLYDNGEQVGGGIFPFILGEDLAFDLAKSMGDAFAAL
jgi:hypothetical protein